jgi:hypothetical protein
MQQRRTRLNRVFHENCNGSGSILLVSRLKILLVGLFVIAQGVEVPASRATALCLRLLGTG